jgi:hypothetical protein
MCVRRAVRGTSPAPSTTSSSNQLEIAAKWGCFRGGNAAFGLGERGFHARAGAAWPLRALLSGLQAVEELAQLPEQCTHQLLLRHGLLRVPAMSIVAVSRP